MISHKIEHFYQQVIFKRLEELTYLYFVKYIKGNIVDSITKINIQINIHVYDQRSTLHRTLIFSKQKSCMTLRYNFSPACFFSCGLKCSMVEMALKIACLPTGSEATMYLNTMFLRYSKLIPSRDFVRSKRRISSFNTALKNQIHGAGYHIVEELIS